MLEFAAMKCIIAGERMAELLERHRQSVSRSPGLAILGARSGEELLALHRQHLAQTLVLDVLMPGTPPEEICRIVRADARLREVSLIVIGGRDSEGTLRRCAANRSFLRPLDREDFLGAVRALCDVSARRDFRVLVGLQVSGTVRSAPFLGRSENISATGILFSTNRMLDVGDRPELSLMLPGQGQVLLAAEVVRVEPVPGRDPRFGARFIDPGRQARQMLAAFIEKRLTHPPGRQGG